MTLEMIAMTVLWTFFFGYVIVGSIDYGAGFFNAYSIVTKKDHVISNIFNDISHLSGK